MKKSRLQERREALRAVLLSESILDWLIDATLGSYLQLKANELKTDPEWKRIQKRIKELEAKSLVLKKEAERYTKKAMDKEKRDSLEKNKHIKPAKKTKPL